MHRVAVIVNAHAHAFVARPALVDAVVSLAEGRATVAVTHDARELRLAAERARDDAADVVVLCGGDGSYSAGATAIHAAFSGRSAPILALAPGGTVGTVPRSLGVAAKGSTLDGIAHVLHRACGEGRAVIEQPTLSVVADGGARRLSFIFGTGLVASFFEIYDPRGAERQRRGELEAPSGGAGLLGAALIVGRIFVESFYGGAYARRVLTPMACEVRVDRGGGDELLPWRASSLVVASVVGDLGLGMRVTHRAAEDPQRPHVVVSGLSPRALGPRMPRVLAARRIGDDGEPHFDDLVERLTVRFPDAPGPYVLEGDLRIAREVIVTAGPTIRLLRLAPTGDCQ